MNKNYTPKQIEKYKRQKYISALEKCTKNLFRLFRDENSTVDKFTLKFKELKKDLDKLDEIRLDVEYLKKTKEYIDRLYKNTILNKNFSQKEYQDIKNPELSNLNRLQKMKNRTKYSKEKYKKEFF
jgi:hypothetical protein